MKATELKRLKVESAKIRLDVIKMLQWRRYGHLGGAMSIVELLSVLYGRYMKYDPKDPKMEDRDHLVLSKGHAGPALYSTLANKGFFDKEMLFTLNEIGTRLPSHPDRLRTPGVDATTGSLGQGTSVACGLGYSLRLEKSPRRVFLICGDGELNEGQPWEAFQFIAHHNLNEVVVFIDKNGMQLDGTTDDIMRTFDLKKKMEAFGFYTLEVNGNDEEELCKAIDEVLTVKDQAVCIVMNTIKGYGVPYYYGRKDNHSPKFNEESDKELDIVKAQLEEFIKENGGE